eukprot:TRINITY_DN2346_c0_g1_i1.p1 TRINITY_DN2346_c0_g1~~TRINITY_DN2346_c0_g1_i1.p1  ORF type:complete len:180 (-),score=36.45 TRINITY_DN2346_c0_g1_i1:280-819(-)
MIHCQRIACMQKREGMAIHRCSLHIGVSRLFLSFLLFLPFPAFSSRPGAMLQCCKMGIREHSATSTIKSQSQQKEDMKSAHGSGESRKRHEIPGSPSATVVTGRKGSATIGKKRENEEDLRVGGRKQHQQHHRGKHPKYHGPEEAEEEAEEKIYETEDYQSYNPSPTLKDPPHTLIPTR